MGIVKGLDIGKRAILAQSEAVKTTGQNIANANIPGYSRRKIQLASVTYAGNEMIQSLDVHRIRDEYADLHIRNGNHSLGKWNMMSQLFNQIENTFLEPSDSGLNNALSQFWNNWEDLANNPENITPRSMIVQQGMVIAQSINRLDNQLNNIRKVADDYIKDKVTEINNIASQLAEINSKSLAREAGGQEASDIRDARDLLIDNLSKLVNISTIERDNGAVAVLIGGRTLVDDIKYNSLETRQIVNSGMLLNNIVWEGEDSKVSITSGEIAGLLEIRDDVIPPIKDQLDQLASTLINEINKIHKEGYGYDGSTDLDFFSGTNAHDIQVNAEIALDARKVAASGTGETGSNSVALSMAALANENLDDLGNTNIGGFYSNILNVLGAQSQSASVMRENAEILLTNLEEQKESVSGVSLDEEAADLIRFQHAYESAARYISVVDELIQVLLELK